MDAVLVTSPNDGRVPLYFRSQSPGVCFLASYLRDHGFEAEIIDAYLHDLAPEEVTDRVLALDPVLVGLSVPDVVSLRPLMDIADRLRSSGCRAHITAGGYMPTVGNHEILGRYRSLDSVIRGEGEIPLLDLVAALKNKAVWTGIPGVSFADRGRVVDVPLREPIRDLDALPFMACDDLPFVLAKGSRQASIFSSRGCYGNCSFCCMPAFYEATGSRGWRARSPQNILDEIESLIGRFGARTFYFTDENFIGGHERARIRAREFIGLLRKNAVDIRFSLSCRADDVDFDIFRDLKDVGLWSVFLGLESGLQGMLDRFDKDIAAESNVRALDILDRLEIDYFPSYIMMDADTTVEEFIDNLRFLRSNDIAIHPGYILKKLIVIPKTKIQHTLAERGKLTGNFWDGYHYPMNDRMDTLCSALSSILRPLIDLANTIDIEMVPIDSRSPDMLISKSKKSISMFSIGVAEEAAEHVLNDPTPDAGSRYFEGLRKKAALYTDNMCKLIGFILRTNPKMEASDEGE